MHQNAIFEVFRHIVNFGYKVFSWGDTRVSGNDSEINDSVFGHLVHIEAVFTGVHLTHLISSRLRCSALVMLVHYYPLQMLQIAQCTETNDVFLYKAPRSHINPVWVSTKKSLEISCVRDWYHRIN